MELLGQCFLEFKDVTKEFKDACSGDSGGPLTVESGDGEDGAPQVLVGVVSAGVGCGRPMLPGIYTRISMYTEWVKTMVDAPVD